MALQDDYLKACIPEPYRILGQRLRPFSLGHSFVLNRMGNPFVVADSGRVPSLGDLYFAVWVCRQDYHSVLKGLHNGTFVKDIKWLKLVSFLRNTELAKIRMAQYIIAAGKPPNIWQSSSKDSKKMTMPYLLWLKFCMMSKLGYTSRDVMNLPLSEAVWLSIAYSESEGGASFQTDREAELIKIAKQMGEQEALARKEPVLNDGR